ncbi:MAG TPA: hypothetical protein VMS76_06260 [Planctomycetota bacterium]|nr:hypothetical protein [Planctomycetota bacterium]
MKDPRPARSRRREFGLALGVAFAGALGALPLGVAPGMEAGPDPVALLVWLSVRAVGAGWLCGALGVPLSSYALAAPGAWMVALALAGAASERDLPAPLWAALAWTGLFAAGHGLGRLAPRSPVAGAGLCVLAAGLLVALPGRGSLAREPWPPEAARLLLELSPATLLCESAGIDWMRHPSVYAPAGTDRFQRAPYRGRLAGPAVLLLGCLLSAGAAAVDRSRTLAAREGSSPR